MKAKLDVSLLARLMRACLLLALVLFTAPPAYCEELNAEQIIERCKSKLDQQEAVVLRTDCDKFIVLAARNHSLEGEIVILKHVLGAAKEECVYLFYKPGSNRSVIKLPDLGDDLSQQEVMTLRRYYAAKGKITITVSSRRYPNVARHKPSRRAHSK